MTNGNRESNIRPSMCTAENYLQNHIHQQLKVPGNHSYSKATRHQRIKTLVTGESHLR